jgi:processive 1,2-diacylglycerol beta-glucosyltransferase
MPPRVLVLSASVGAGHLRAGQAVGAAIQAAHPDITVRHVDVLEVTNRAFRRVYGKAYIDLVNRAPHVLGYIYDLLDKPVRSKRGDRLRLAWQKLNLRKLTRFLCEEPWDLVINTHFLPCEIIAELRKDGKLKIPQVTATTDFDTHRLWVYEPCERFFTATEEGALYLHSWGVPPGATRVTGIPIHPVFAEPKSRDECVKRQGLTGDRPIVLQLAGGFGVGPVAKIYEQLLRVGPSLEIVVVCGRNEKAKAQLADIQPPPRHRVKLLGYTDQMDELMAAADMVVTKPGGLTTSEALARGLPMVIMNPIPGQESRNSDYLLEQGAAVKCNNLATLGYKVGGLVESPGRLGKLRDNAKRLGKPRAAFDVVAESLKLIEK